MRLCPNCATASSIRPGEPIWPEGWSCDACRHAVTAQDGFPLLAPELVGTNSGFEAEGFDDLAAAEDTHFWFKARSRLFSGLLDQHFGAARSFMEIGCGNGAVLKALAGSRSWDRLVGSELHPEGLTTARRRLHGEAELFQMDARRIPFREEFDAVGAFDVIEHIAEDERVIAEMRRVIKPGGGVMIAVPQHPWLWSPADEYAHHVRRYRRGELEGKLEAAGFRILASTSFTAVLLPLMAASRLMGAARARLGRAAQGSEAGMEVRCAEPLNGILHAILDREVSLTLRGVRWPAGGSRVVVATADP